MFDRDLVVLLIGAMGGAFVSGLIGFLTTVTNNKHALRIREKNDEYSDKREKQNVLAEFLEELVTKHLIRVHHDDFTKTILNAQENREEILKILVLTDRHMSVVNREMLGNLKEIEYQKYVSTSDLFKTNIGNETVPSDLFWEWINSLLELYYQLKETLIEELRAR